MNKILWDQKEEIKKDGLYCFSLSKDTKNIELVIFPKVCATLLFLGSVSDISLKITLLREANLVCQVLGENLSGRSLLELKEEKASVRFVESVISRGHNALHLEIFHQAKDTTSEVVNHVVHYGSSKCFLAVDAYIPKGMTGCKVRQDNKIILMDDGKAEILPNLFVSEFDSFAEHSAYISKFSKEALFYLEMRGIPLKDATILLKKAFLLGPLELEGVSSDIQEAIFEQIGR